MHQSTSNNKKILLSGKADNRQNQLSSLVIAGFILLNSLLLLVKFSSLLQLIHPLGSLLIAIFLYSKDPCRYLSFSYWTWFISPLLARLVEYQNHWVNPDFRLIILSPYLVTIVSAIASIKYFDQPYRKIGLPFALAFSSILYAVFVSLVRGHPIVYTAERFLAWTPGIFLGFYILTSWRRYPEHKRSIEKTFFWATIIMAVYGIIQYVYPIPWDHFWLSNADNLKGCCGWPDPWSIRVWSTLNYPFTFAYSISACLLLLFGKTGKLNILATSLGLLVFLLSRVRGAWLGWGIGLMTLFLTSKSSSQIRLILVSISIVALLYPLISMGPFSSDLVARFTTLSEISQDGSFNARLSIYRNLIGSVIFDIAGRGIGGKKIIDAGFLDIISTLGWIGLIPYMAAVFLLLKKAFTISKLYLDDFTKASRAISFSVIFTLPFNNSLLLLPGTFFWSFLGFTLAGAMYNKYITQENL
jgi:hypothetical protein